MIGRDETVVLPVSLRDYFASHAMAAYLTAPNAIGKLARSEPDEVAQWAYESADAMLKERERVK